MGMKITGFDKLTKTLKQLEQNAKRLNGKHQIPLGELFSDTFMQAHTQFASIEEMFAASPWPVKSQEDLEAIPDAPWDEFISQHTNFSSWADMMHKAGEKYFGKRLFAGIK